jgi:hypothetical protein
VGWPPVWDERGLGQGSCNTPAFRTKRRVELGPLCIHASKKLSKFFANSKNWREQSFYLITFRVRGY